jgi:class 3 adenylate cyclase
MDCYAVLAQVIDLLQREGRTSYRALKRQFDVDDDSIEDLEEELIEVRRLAVDEHGSILVWTGGAAQPPQAETTPTVPPAPDAERRQLTVLFCDLVDATALARQLDPEVWRDVVRAYQQACAAVIQCFDGSIAQYRGDGLLVYFGYPQAHEEDAQRAMRTGLGMVEALGRLHTRLQPEKAVWLAIRVGVHTGLVVVGEMGGGARREHLALGDPPNLAARLPGLAEPDNLVISTTTYHLVEGVYACHALGPQVLKGIATPVPVYQVVGARGPQSRFDLVSPAALTPLVGREQEVGLLLERWRLVQEGRGQVVVLSGEAGIGKSRLVQVVKTHVAGAPHTRWECRASPSHQHSVLYPLIDLCARALQWRENDTPDARLEKLEAALAATVVPLLEVAPLLAALLADDPAAAADRDAYLAEHIFWVPKDARWSSMATQERCLSTDQGRSASSGRVIDPSFPISWGGTSYAA